MTLGARVTIGAIAVTAFCTVRSTTSHPVIRREQRIRGDGGTREAQYASARPDLSISLMANAEATYLLVTNTGIDPELIGIRSDRVPGGL